MNMTAKDALKIWPLVLCCVVGCQTPSITIPSIVIPAYSNAAPVPGPVAPAPVVGGIYNDDQDCNLILKHNGREIESKGQVTYLKGILTSQPFDGACNVCLQYNDIDKGEVTVWKDLDNRSIRRDNLAGAMIDKIVVWYEDRPIAPVIP